MLIHTYFTDGYYQFGKIFIKSFKKLHGETNRLVVTTRDLSEIQITELKTIYSNIIILNKKINMKRISKLAKKDVKTLLKYKRDTELGRLSKKNIVWKQYISVEDRYRDSILEAIQYAEGEKFMMHIDADSYIEKNLEPIFDVIMKNDISLLFRLHKAQLNRKIFGCLSGYKLGEKTFEFLECWKKYIDKIPLYNKPVGYGQKTCYLAYKELQRNIEWGHIPAKWVSKKLKAETLIWVGNQGKGKQKTIKIFENELRSKK